MISCFVLSFPVASPDFLFPFLFFFPECIRDQSRVFFSLKAFGLSGVVCLGFLLLVG